MPDKPGELTLITIATNKVLIQGFFRRDEFLTSSGGRSLHFVKNGLGPRNLTVTQSQWSGKIENMPWTRGAIDLGRKGEAPTGSRPYGGKIFIGKRRDQPILLAAVRRYAIMLRCCDASAQQEK